MNITGGSALVTGGASGLGLATVESLVAAGMRVVIADLPGQAGVHATGRWGERVRFAPTDVVDENQVGAAVYATAELGPLRVVVNCAGIGPPQRVIGRGGPMPLNDFRRVIDINLLGSFNVVRLAAALMSELEPVEGERGVIVNTASVAAFDGQVGQAAYAASKAALVGLTLPLAREFATHLIRVVTVAPGLFKTPLFATLSDEAIQSLSEQVPHPSRLGEPSEFASLVSQVIANPMLNGETIRLDGSIRMAAR